MKYITPIPPPSQKALVGQVYRQIRQDFVVVPDLFLLHSPIPELLAGVWSVMRETEMVGQVPWPLKEAVAATVSQLNQCPYCVEIHTALADAGMRQSLTDLIKQGRVAEISDPFLRSLVMWAQATRSPTSALLLAPPFSTQQAPEIIGIAVINHYINRMVEVFLSESLLPSFFRGAWMRKVIWSQVGQKLAHGRNKAKVAGTSLRFLSEANLPAELSWAAPSPVIGSSFSRWAAVVDRIGAEILSQRVRALVTDFLQTWRGEFPALGRAWVNQAVAGLSEVDQVAGKLTLLASVAPYQIDEEIVEAFRMHHRTDAQLVGAVAWASYSAACLISSWLQVPVESKNKGT